MATGNDTVDSALESAQELVQTWTGLSTRTIRYVAVLVCMFLTTNALGTLMLVLAGIVKRWRKQEESPPKKQSLQEKGSQDLAVRVPEDGRRDRSSELSISQKRWWHKCKKKLVMLVYAFTYILCFTAAMVSILTEQLSQEHGLAWEFYTGLFACGCLWVLLQAAFKAYMLPNGRHFAKTAFVQATITGICPVFSDSFDTMKDVTFGFLCFAADNLFVNAVGVLALLWLPVYHAILLRDPAFYLELAANHTSVLELRSLPPSGPSKIDYSDNWQAEVDKMMADKDPDLFMLRTKKGFLITFVTRDPHLELSRDPDEFEFPVQLISKVSCLDRAKAWSQEFLLLVYKQLTPTKRKMLLWENVPQSVFAFIYILLVGDSLLVALLNLAIPTAQIILAFGFFKNIRLLVAPKLAKRIDDAFHDKDLVQIQRLRKEAGLDSDAGLFEEVCEHSKRLQGFIPKLDDDELGDYRRVYEAWQRSRFIFLNCFDSMTHIKKELALVEELKGKQHTHIQGIVDIVSSFHLEGVTTLKMSSNDITPEGSLALAKGLTANKSIENLDMSGNKIGAEGTQALLTALCENTLLFLALCGNGLGTGGAQAVAEYLKKKNTIKVLRLDNNDFADAGSKVLAGALISNASVTSLHLRGNNIGSAGIQELSEMLKKNTTLESFDLRNNKIDVECLEALAKAMSQNDNIKQLYIFEAKASMKRQPSGVCSIATTSTARSNRSIASYKRKPTAEDQETMQKRFAQWFSNTFTWTSTIGTKGTGEDVAQDSEKEPVEEAENVVKFLRCCGQQWPEDGLKLDEVFLKTVQAIEGQESAEGTSRMSKMLRKLSEVIINQEQRTLVLAHMLLGDEEAKELAQAVGGLLKLSKVQVINLYGNGDIGFRGLQALAKAVSNNNDIKKLYIFREAKDSHGQPSPNVGEVVSEDRLVAFMRQCGRALLQGQCKSVKTGTNSVVPRRSRLSQTSMTANGGGLILGDVFSKVIQAIESQEASAVQQAPCNNAVRFTDTSDPMRKESEVRTPQMSKMLRKLSEVIINQENQLNLSSMDLTDEEAEVLAQAVRGLLNISDIRVIDLRNNKISVSGLEALAKALSKHATVQELYIVSDDIQGGNEKEVNKSLLALMRKWGRALHHQETTLSSVLKEVFATAIKKETLLDLKKMHLNDKDVEELAPLLPRVLQCKVQVIDLRNNDMGLDGFKALAKASVNDELLKGLLIFSSDSQGNQEEKEALLALMRKWGAVLQSQDRLKQEETKLNKVFSKVFEATMKKAEVLDLSKMGLSNVEAQALAEGVLGLLKISNVQFIDLRSSEIGLYGFEALAKAFSMNFTLKRLKIFSPDGEGNEEASGVLLNFMRQCGTALLNQDRFKLGNICLDVMKALEGQEQNGKVLKALQMLGKAIAHQEKTLSLNAMKLDLEETKAVVEAMYLHLTLEELWLRGCGLGDEGVKAVAKALERKSALRRLDVDENGIGDEGTEALVNALEVNTTLEMLYIGRNRGISAQGRQELEMVRKKKLAHGQDFRWF